MYLLFVCSEHHTNFQKENPGATVGYTTWSNVLNKVNTFVTDPKPEYCVDEKISGLEHYMAALLAVFKWNSVKEGLEGYSDVGDRLGYDSLVQVLRKAGAFQMVEAVFCPKEEQPDMHIDRANPVPKSFRSGAHTERMGSHAINVGLG